MRTTRACPKCQGRRFLVNEKVGFRQKMYKGQEPYIAALPVVARVQSTDGGFFGSSSETEELGTYESWSCVGCGFTELYATGLESLVARGAGRVVE